MTLALKKEEMTEIVANGSGFYTYKLLVDFKYT